MKQSQEPMEGQSLDRSAVPVENVTAQEGGADISQDIKDNRARIEELKEEEEEYERAKGKLVQQVRDSRTELMSEFESVEQEMRAQHASGSAITARKKELAEDKAARLADRFMPSEQMAIMKKLLKNVSLTGEEARGKFEFLVMVGFKLKYWNKGDYSFKLNKKTEGIDEGFEEEQQQLDQEFMMLETEWNVIESETPQG